MADQKAPTHLEAEDILLAMDTAPNIEEHVRRLLLYIRAAEQVEDRLQTIADETNGPHEVIDAEEAMTRIERGISDYHRKLFAAEKERDELKDYIATVCEIWKRDGATIAELKAKLSAISEHSDAILEALAWIGDDSSPEFKTAAKAVEEAIK